MREKFRFSKACEFRVYVVNKNTKTLCKNPTDTDAPTPLANQRTH